MFAVVILFHYFFCGKNDSCIVSLHFKIKIEVINASIFQQKKCSYTIHPQLFGEHYLIFFIFLIIKYY